MCNFSGKNNILIVFLVGILLALFQFVSLPQGTVYAATGEPDVLAFTSDVHNNQNNYDGEERLGIWIDNVISQYGKIDAMAFGGDMAQYNSADDRFWSETKRVMDVVEGKGITAYYTTGNHEYAHPYDTSNNFYPDKNEVTQKYIQNDWAVSDNDHNYRIYCMGVGEASNYTYAQNAYTENQVTTLQSKLAGVDNTKPIFIITHFPLHYSNSRTITLASDVIDVLNTAATGGTPSDPSDDKKIVFIWGHNHSQNNPNDTHYDTIYQKGSSLQYDSSSSHTKEIQFFYAAAGAMCDSEKDPGSAKVEGKGLVATVNTKGQIALAYHKADGTTVTKNGGPFTEQDPVEVEDLTIEEAADAGQDGLSVEAGKKIQLHATVEPSNATEKTVTWSSSDTTVAKVDSTGKVTGVSEGQATITASLADSASGETFTDSIVVNVTPRTTSGTPYVLTNTLTPGKNYLIVSANSGDAYALKNDNGTVSKEEVTIDGDTIYADNEDIVFEAQGSGTTTNNLHNGSHYVKASSSGLEMLTTPGDSRPWEYNSSNHSLRNYKSGSNPSYYYLYFENNAFTSVKSTVHEVYIFEETEPQEDVTYNVTFKVENGKWDDNSSADKTVQVTGPAGSELKLSADQIPAVGTKPNSGYQAGSWDVTPDTSTSITGDVTYTYTYAEQAQPGGKAYVLTNQITPGKNYIIASANSGTAKVLTSSSTTAAEVTIDGDTIYTDDASIVFKMGETGGSVNFIGNEDGYVNHTSDNYLEFVSTPPSGITWTYDGSYLNYKSGSTTYYLYYKSGTNYNRYRIKNQSSASSEQIVYLFEEVQTDVSYDVTFQVENGKWNDDTTEEKKVTLTGPVGTELKLSAEQIPAVGDKADTHYKSGEWDTTPDTNTAITEDITYKYNYEFVDHVWNDGVVTTPATCTEDGVKTFTCSIGGETRTEAIPATGHSWNEDYTVDTEATCTESGSKSKHCSVCGAIDETSVTVIPATGHNFGEWTEVTPSSCENPGLEQHVCGTCGLIESRNLDPAGHDWEDEFTVDVEATCTTDGSRSKHCKKCDAVKDSETIQALGHDYHEVEESAVSPSCTEDGKYADEECSRCHDVVTGNKIDRLGHDYKVVEDSAVAPTCTEGGKEANQKCSRCNDVIEGAHIDALGHKYGAWTKLNDNEHQRVCERDGSHIEKAPHTWGEWTTITPPNCIEAGELERSCTECGAKETKNVEAYGHQLMPHEAVSPTCTEAGNNAYWQCVVCKNYYSDANGENELEENGWVVPANGHNMTNHPEVEATCTEDGNYEYWDCDRCNKFFADEEGDREVEEGTWVIPAGHDWSKPTYSWAEDYSSVTAEYHCMAEGCNEKVTETVEPSSEVTKQPTCTEDGATKYTASFEDQRFVDQEATDNTKPAATGHDWSKPTYEWSRDNSSVTAEYHCTAVDCDEEVTETVETTSEVTKDPTCMEPGTTKYTATFEDPRFEDLEDINDTEPAALGHDWAEATYTSPKTCKRCHETEGEALSHDTSEERYVEVSQFTNGKDYIVAVTRDNSSVYAIVNAGVSNRVSSATLSVVPASGDDAAYIVTDNDAAVWNYTSSDQFLSNDSLHINRAGSSGNYYPIADSSSGREAHYVNGKLYLKKSSSNSTYYITCNNGTFGLSENESGGDQVRLFEKTTVDIKTQIIKFVDENENVLQESVVVRGQKPSYTGETPTKEDEGDTTYTFAGWTDGTTDYGPEDELPAAVADKTYTTIFNAHHHTWDYGEITKLPTCTTKGEKTFHCTSCDTTKTEDIDALGHNMTEHAAREATCTEAGNSAYYSCDRCQKFFSNEAGKDEIEENSWVITAKGHTWDEGDITKQPTCTTKGEKTFHCTSCDATKTEDIDALWHNITTHEAVAATCTEAGNGEYYSCDRCHKFFLDPLGASEISENSWVIDAKGHDTVKHASTEATCEAAGNLEYHNCKNGCGKFFSDESGNTEIEENSWVITATGHKYGSWTKLNGTQHQRVCEHDAGHIEKANHTWDKGKVTKKATQKNTGVKTFTCTACKATRIETIPKLKSAAVPTGSVTILNTIANSAKRTNDVIWDKSKMKNATNYEINWKARGSSKWSSKTVGNTVRGVTTGLAIKGLYEVRVRGKNAAGAGAWSNTVYRYFHTTEKIRLSSKSKGSFTIKWKKNSQATSYQVMFTTNKNGSGAANNINKISKDKTSFTKKGLKSGKTYYVQIREMKKVGGITYVGNISCPVAVKIK